jgi:dienelactone hydrolase
MQKSCAFHSLVRALTAALTLGVGLSNAFAPAMAGNAEPFVRNPAGATETWVVQHLEIPAPQAGAVMITSVLRPSGSGPFPLAVINHGTVENEAMRAALPAPSFPLLSYHLLKHGFAVVMPQRPGHGETSGPYLESLHSCDYAQFTDAGYGAAASIKAAVDYVMQQPYVKKQRVLLAGHSAGAWAALALASEHTVPVAGVINFSGGLGGHSLGVAGRNCAPDRLAAAAGQFGRTTHVPTLWLYAQNDSYFGPALSRRMADAFRDAGGLVDYRLLPPEGDDGHYLIYSRDAERYWGPIVERFVATLK